MDKDSDCPIVGRCIGLGDLKQWKINYKKPIPFYLHMGYSRGISRKS